MKKDNKERLKIIFSEILELGPSEDVESVRRLTSKKWDSLAHVMIVSAIESEFPVTINEDDYELLTSFNAIELILDDLGL